MKSVEDIITEVCKECGDISIYALSKAIQITRQSDIKELEKMTTHEHGCNCDTIELLCNQRRKNLIAKLKETK